MIAQGKEAGKGGCDDGGGKGHKRSYPGIGVLKDRYLAGKTGGGGLAWRW